MNESDATIRHFDLARSWLMCDGSVLFYGVPNHASVEALIDDVGGRRVLRCRAADTDPDRPLGALISLFSSVGVAELGPLSSEHRETLVDWIFRAGPTAAPAPSTSGLGSAVLALLRLLSASTPLFLVLDAVHRLDRGTREVLEFVAKRVDELPIHMLAVEEARGASTPEGYRLAPPPLVMIRLPDASALPALTRPRLTRVEL